MTCDHCHQSVKPGTCVAPHIAGQPHPERMKNYRADGYVCQDCLEDFSTRGALGQWTFRRRTRKGAKAKHA